MPSTPTYRPCYTGNSVPLILCYLVFQNLLIITTVETYTHCYRFRWSGEGSRDAIVVSSVPMSETRSYFEIGESVSPYVSIYFSYIIYMHFAVLNGRCCCCCCCFAVYVLQQNACKCCICFVPSVL